MTARNRYAPPQSDISSNEIDGQRKPSAWIRFGLSAAWSMGILMALILVIAPMSEWLVAALGAGVISALAGVVGICIPAKRKLTFVGAGLTVTLAVLCLLSMKW